MVSGFYAEPFVALLLVLGWRTMRIGRLSAGALVMGLAGLFRPEAGVVVALFAACCCAFCGNLRLKLTTVVCSVVPTLAWNFGGQTLPSSYLIEISIISIFSDR